MKKYRVIIEGVEIYNLLGAEDPAPDSPCLSQGVEESLESIGKVLCDRIQSQYVGENIRVRGQEGSFWVRVPASAVTIEEVR